MEVEDIKDLFEGLTKIELTADSGTFVIHRGRHPEPGPDGYPWESSANRLIDNRVSVFEGQNTLSNPSDFFDHYVLEDTDYDKVCDLLLFFDFGTDRYRDSDSGTEFNSNSPEKIDQRRSAAAKLLIHFKNTPISICSITSSRVIFMMDRESSKPEDRARLGEAVWHHNNIYYPRPRLMTNAEELYSSDRYRELAVEHGLFIVGWDDN